MEWLALVPLGDLGTLLQNLRNRPHSLCHSCRHILSSLNHLHPEYLKQNSHPPKGNGRPWIPPGLKTET
jgi:hypothetical protein